MPFVPLYYASAPAVSLENVPINDTIAKNKILW